jgi:PAS domain S-box-containing protein
MLTPAKRHPRIVRYAAGAGFVAAAALLQWAVFPWVGNHAPFLFFMLALVFAVIALGRGPATLVLIGGMVNGALLSPPVRSLGIQYPNDLAAVLVFGVVGTVVVVFGNRLRLTSARVAAAERRLALALENTGVGIFEFDFPSGTAFVSASLCRILGRTVIQGEISLQEWFGALRPEHVEESRRHMQQRVLERDLRYEREQRVLLPNGEIRWLLNRVELEATPDGVLTHARGATVDITARKQVDDLLKVTQENLQQQLLDQDRLLSFSQKLVSAGEAMPAALKELLDILVDLYQTRFGVMSLCNAEDKSLAVIATAGFDAESVERLVPALNSKAARPRVHRVHPRLDSADYESILVAHEALSAEAGLQGMHSLPLQSATGEVMGAMSVMFGDPHQQSERQRRLGEACAATAAAVLERERARTAATQNENRFSVALESSAVPFCILAPIRHAEGHITDFRWTYLNPAAAVALGRPIEELRGKDIGVLVPRAWDEPELFDRYVRVIEHGEQIQFETRSQATGRGVFWFNVVAAPLRGSAAVWFTDITAHKIHEKKLQDADRRKDEFLATLAHELRNPLAPIRQAARIAGARSAGESQRRWSHAIIERQVQHMSLVLDDLLDVSRIGRGTLLLRKSGESLAAIVDTAVETVRPHMEAKRHDLEITLPETPLILDVDPVRMAQVLTNLLTNAAKYTDPGGQIRLSAGLEAGLVTICIRDNGIGLTKAQEQEVFQMFSQVPAAADKSQGGLGIGLALARGIIELHGGTLTASSPGLGLGTEFNVRLPIACVVARGAPAGAVSEQVAVAGAGPVRRILIADDNVDAADSLAELLRLDGHEVHVAYDGAQALATFAEVEPDAALLDVGMPQISGLEVVKAIRQRPTGQRATLIAITGWGQERDRIDALEAGFDHHLTKPMVPEEIGRLLARGRRTTPTA